MQVQFNMMKLRTALLFAQAMFTLALVSSCVKRVECSGLPEEMEGYFPIVDELKFSNGIGDTLILPVQNYARSSPRTLSSNPLSVGGTGATPVCSETFEIGSTFQNPIYWSFDLVVADYNETTEINLSITEEGVSSNNFNKVVNETPNKLGDYKVFGDTIIMPVIQPLARFTEAQIIYGIGLVKLHDEVNNCDWTRIW